jgi:ribonucrease Y
MDTILLIPMVIILVALFFYLGWMFNSKVGKRSIASAEERSKQIIADAQKEANNLKREKLLEVKDEWYKKKVEFDGEVNQKKQKISNIEKQLVTREENIEKKFDAIIKKERENKQFERELTELKKNIEFRNNEVSKLELEQNTRLEKISGLTSEEAKRMLIENMISQAKTDSSVIIKQIHDRAKADAKKDAQKIVVQAIQRTAADHCVETTVSVVQIQNDDMKGESSVKREEIYDLSKLLPG